MSDNLGAALDFGVRIPLVELLGMTLHHMAQGESKCYSTGGADSFGVTHGGR